jgi:hypothetical protein
MNQYITEYEGNPPNKSDDTQEGEEAIATSFGEINIMTIANILQNQATIHTLNGSIDALTYSDEPKKADITFTDQFLTNDRYNSGTFYGILIDTGAATKSTAGIDQVRALQAITDVKLDESRAGEFKALFGIGEAISIRVIEVITPIGKLEFHIMNTAIPFLLCLQDMDRAGYLFNNIANKL